jgi:hypothetical protein
MATTPMSRSVTVNRVAKHGESIIVELDVVGKLGREKGEKRVKRE